MPKPQNIKTKRRTIAKPVASARAQAAALLALVLEDRLTLDEAVAKAPLAGTSPDQRFAMLLVMTVLQHLGQLDAVIAPFLDRPLPVRSEERRVGKECA